MNTAGLGTNQLSDQAYQWYLSYLEALDAKDIDRYGAFLAPDCVMLFNSNPEVRGRAAVLENLAGYWQSFGTLTHDLLNIYGTDASFVLEALNHYTRRDGKPVTLRAVAITDRDEGGLVRSFRLYTDTGPLFSE